MPGAVINHTAAGVPYLDPDNYVAAWPAYTLELANLFSLLGSPSAALLDLLTQAQTARDAAQAAKTAAEAAAVPTWWRGQMAGTVSHTSGNYRSLGVTTKAAGENCVMTISGDAIIPPAGVWEVGASVQFPSNGTGYREAALIINPGATSYNGTVAPVGTLLEDNTLPGISGSNATLVIPKRTRRFNGTTDKVLLYAYQNSGGALTIPAGVHQVDIELRRVGA